MLGKKLFQRTPDLQLPTPIGEPGELPGRRQDHPVAADFGRVGLLPLTAQPETRAEAQAPEQELTAADIAANPLVNEIPEAQRQEAIANTLELYNLTKETVAPVITGFADELLREAGDQQIIFAARDGLGAFEAAKALKEKFDYGNTDPDQLMYAYLTRKVVWNTEPDDMTRYLKETGVRDPHADILLADIGMYGSIMSSMKNILPGVQARYLISKSASIPGYASSPEKPMNSLNYVSGNPGVHLMEDTYSGPIDSPNRLIEKDGKLVPNTIDTGFPPEEALKREYALKAIKDYAKGLTAPPVQPPTQAIEALDSMLAKPERFKHLMVPHIK